jgi:hypothetical protein
VRLNQNPGMAELWPSPWPVLRAVVLCHGRMHWPTVPAEGASTGAASPLNRNAGQRVPLAELRPAGVRRAALREKFWPNAWHRPSWQPEVEVAAHRPLHFFNRRTRIPWQRDCLIPMISKKRDFRLLTFLDFYFISPARIVKTSTIKIIKIRSGGEPVLNGGIGATGQCRNQTRCHEVSGR